MAFTGGMIGRKGGYGIGEGGRGKSRRWKTLEERQSRASQSMTEGLPAP